MVTQNPTSGGGKSSKSRVMVVGSIELVADSGLPSTTNTDIISYFYAKVNPLSWSICFLFRLRSPLQQAFQNMCNYINCPAVANAKNCFFNRQNRCITIRQSLQSFKLNLIWLVIFFANLKTNSSIT